MWYTIDPSVALADEVRRIAGAQIEAARADLADPGDDVVDAVHDCRKRCKKLRGLVRLVRPALGDDYRRANILFREIAGELSDLRDAHALLGSFDALMAAPPASLPDGGLGSVRSELHRRSRRASEWARPDAGGVERARELLEDAQRLVDSWELDESGFDAIAGGLKKTYGRAREALHDSISEPSTERFHEYRKRTKYTWYHVRLLNATAPSMLGPFADALHDLSDTLGDEHDLAVLDEQIAADPEAFGGEDPVDSARGLISSRRTALQERAVRLGCRLHAEKPKSLVRRFGAYWDSWQEHGEELGAGELGDLWPPVDDGLEDLTVDELRRRAQDEDVDGRSTMRRDDLVAALRAEG